MRRLWLLLLLAVTLGCSQIDSGQIGVYKSWGAIQPEVMTPGLYFMLPFRDSMVKLNTKLVPYEVTTSASSKDLQIVKTVIHLQNSLDPGQSHEALAKVGDLLAFEQTVVDPAVAEGLKEVTAKYTAEELITHREAVKKEIEDAINAYKEKTLSSKGIPGALIIANVSLKNFDFSDDFTHAIEAKMTAAQDALKAQNDKIKRITNAEAAAKEQMLAADATAYAIEKNSLMKAAAIKREADALTANPAIERLRAIERWDGVLPKWTTGGNAMPFINVAGLEPAGK